MEEVINKARWVWHQNEFGHGNFEHAMAGGALGLNEQMDNSAIQAEWERTFVWIGDTGASCHMTCVWSRFVECKTTSARACFRVVDDEVDTSAVGTWKGGNHLKRKQNVCEKGGLLTMNKTLFIPELRNNLCSVTVELGQGAKLESEGKVPVLKCPNGSKLKFNCMLRTKDGHVPGAVIQPIGNDVTKDSNDLKHLNEQSFHEASTHIFEGHLIPTAEGMGHKLTGKLGNCVHCGRAKATKRKLQNLQGCMMIFWGKELGWM